MRLSKWLLSRREEGDTQPPVGGEGSGAPPAPWYGTVDPDLEDVVKPYKDPVAFIKAHKALRTDYSSRKAIPGENAKPEELEAFWNQVGRPEKPEGYGEYTPPEGHQWDKETERKFAAHAHKLGLTKAQLKGVLDFEVQRATEANTANTAEGRAAEEKAWAELRAAWGANADRNVALAQKAIVQGGGKGLVEALNRTGLGNDPHFLQFAKSYGDLLVEDGIIPQEMAGVGEKDAKTEIDALLKPSTKDWKNPYWDASHPDHKRAVERMADLMRTAYPERLGENA